jgi:hypothetical protein
LVRNVGGVSRVPFSLTPDDALDDDALVPVILCFFVFSTRISPFAIVRLATLSPRAFWDIAALFCLRVFLFVDLRVSLQRSLVCLFVAFGVKF